MTRVLVLAGGFGKRLRPVVEHLPKPLAPVAGKSFLNHLCENWACQGVKSITFLLHYKAEVIMEFLRHQELNGSLKGCAVDVVVEPSPLGTGGAVAYGVKQLDIKGDFLVANADTWLSSGIAVIANSMTPTIATVEVEDTRRFGRIQVHNGKVTSFFEKQHDFGRGQINAGLYHLNSELFSAWDGASFSIERDVFPRLAKNGDLNAVKLNTDFIDIGVPDDYIKFCRWVKSGKKEPL